VDLARRARLGQSTVSLLERGHIDGLSIRALRRACAALDADLVLLVRWRGGDLDRLLDERHARLGARLARILESLRWEVSPEVTFAIYGERGSIDLLAWHAATRTLLVVEIKSELTSAEETLRRLDVKVRLAPQVAVQRLGWRPAKVARLLVLPADRTSRRRVAAHSGIMARAFPTATAAVRHWLRHPSGSIAGLLFVTDSDHDGPRHRLAAQKRIKRRHPAIARA
jgi:transcriptional regulator with XRE-family HTH domain